jgi:hypothetical protein
VTSRAGTDDANRYIDPGFLLVLNARRPRISHRYRDIAVRRWTGSGFGHTVTSQNERRRHSTDRPRFPIGGQCTPTSYLAPLPRYSGSKVDRKRFRPYGDVTDRKRRRRSIDRPRFPISAQCTPTSYLAPLPRYRGSKVDRKRFRPYGDVTDRKRRRHSIDRPRFPISAQCTPTSYLAPLPRYRGSKVDRKRFRPYGDVTDSKRRRHSTDLTSVSYRWSMHADLVSRTVTEI